MITVSKAFYCWDVVGRYPQQSLRTREHSENSNERCPFAKRGNLGPRIGKTDGMMLSLHNHVLFPFRMLRSNRITCVGNDSFIGLSSVRLLSLYDNQITTIAPGAFDTLHSLSTL